MFNSHWLRRHQDRVMTLAGLLVIVTLLSTGCSVLRSSSAGSDEQQSSSVSAEEWEKVKRLVQSAEQLYQLTAEGQADEAVAIVKQMVELSTQIRFYGIASLSAVKALMETMEQAEQIYRKAALSQEEALMVSAKLRLLTDAMIHREKQMWLQYYKVFKEDIHRLEEAVQQRHVKEGQQIVVKLQQQFDIIQPALFVSRAASEQEKLKSLLLFLSRQLSAKEVAYTPVVNAIKHFNDAIDEVFQQKEERSTFISLPQNESYLKGSLLIGTFVLLVLFYVGWRMFHTDKRLVFVKNKPPRD